jgi:nucleoside-diphosphate-sugar epimerase
MAQYLITGIAGFIGSSLARALVAQGHFVRGIDNLSTGKTENLDDIAPRIEFTKADVLDEAATLNACRNIDFVLHQAALPSVVSSIADPMTSHRVNADGTVNLLLAARACRVKRVVYASSCAAYGDAPLPNREDVRTRPLSPYAVSKLAGELYMESFYRVYGLETVSLRYFNVFGPRQDAASEYSGAIAKFIRMMLQGQQPTIFGDGEQSRDFTFVDNVVAANLLACTAPTEQVAGQAFNIGSGSPTTVNRVYRTLQQLLSFPSEPAYAPARAGEIKHSYADISLAREKLGYEPRADFEEGMRQTVDSFKNTPRAPNTPGPPSASQG